jgi:hypothetical protein
MSNRSTLETESAAHFSRHRAPGMEEKLSRRLIVCFCALSLVCGAQSIQPIRPTIAVIKQDPPQTHTSKLWVASCLTLLAATSFDAASSMGKHVQTPLLRSADGSFGAKGISIKAAMTGGILIPQLFLHKKKGAERPFTVANFIQTGLYTGIAAHNLGVPQPK